jgi:hypothetical protein
MFVKPLASSDSPLQYQQVGWLPHRIVIDIKPVQQKSDDKMAELSQPKDETI